VEWRINADHSTFAIPYSLFAIPSNIAAIRIGFPHCPAAACFDVVSE
jgi:hypothetical protein